jgi:hypothetical protein
VSVDRLYHGRGTRVKPNVSSSLAFTRGRIDSRVVRRLRSLSLPSLHLLLAAPATALLVVLVPPMQSPDETIHLCRAGTLSRGAFASVVDEHGRVGGYVDTGLWWFAPHFLDVFSGPRAKMTWHRFERARSLHWFGTLTFCEQPGLNYGPISYLPQALGLALGRVFGCSILASYYLARLFAATAGLALGNVALRLMTRGRLLAFVVLVLPMTLFQLASTSQDALQIPGTVLAIALATRLLSSDHERSSRAPWSVAALTVALAMGRPPIAPLALLVLAPPPPGDAVERRRAWRHRIGAVVACGIVLAAWLAAVTPGYHETRRPNRVDVAQQWAGLREHPVRFASVVATSLAVNRVRWARQGVGMIGWLDTPLPNRFYELAWVVLVAAVLVDPFRRTRTDLVTRGLYLAVFASTSACILLALYLIWSNVGAMSIRGVQGRYFVPLVPLLGVALGIGLAAGPRLAAATTATAALFALLSAGTTIAMVVGRYY